MVSNESHPQEAKPYYQSTVRQTASKVIDFVTSLSEAQLSEFWLPCKLAMPQTSDLPPSTPPIKLQSTDARTMQTPQTHPTSSSQQPQFSSAAPSNPPFLPCEKTACNASELSSHTSYGHGRTTTGTWETSLLNAARSLMRRSLPRWSHSQEWRNRVLLSSGKIQGGVRFLVRKGTDWKVVWDSMRRCLRRWRGSWIFLGVSGICWMGVCLRGCECFMTRIFGKTACFEELVFIGYLW